MKGMKLEKSPSTKDKFRELETAFQNTQMALQLSQMMIKHLSNELAAVKNDLGAAMGMLNDFQYRTLSMLEIGNFNKDAIESKAEELKLADFMKASDREDLEKGYEVDDASLVSEDSIIIISSSTPDLESDQGIFRSKFPMTECLTPELRAALLGAKVGDVVNCNIYGTNHAIKIVSLRKVNKQEVKEEENK